MQNKIVKIDNLPHISTLQDIESDFKIYAGPGAGKTTWLISHLERVLKNSSRLGKTKKIACITYTNVAAEEINSRLKCDKYRFDISTIHSFLYRNIVKPFSYLIAMDENGEILFNISNLDGHNEHIVQSDRLRRWIATISDLNGKDYKNYLWPQNKLKVVEELSSLDYVFDGNKIELIIRQHRGARIPKKNNELWMYKSKYWKDGIMHHEDVLYFSFLILQKSPRIVEFIRNKFPYIFIDEFQDTTELQTWIINKICEIETKIGIVGDLAQSIYKFAGAKRTDFLNFKSKSITNFKLNQNHRSTRNIVDFLNCLRPDIKQQYGNNKQEGSQVCILIGAIQAAKEWYEQKYTNSDLFILTRKNTSVFEINNQLGTAKTNLLEELYSNDSISQRARLIHSILMAYKFYVKDNLKSSLDEIFRPLKRVSGGKILKLILRKISINVIESLKDNNNRNKSILNFYTELKQKIFEKYGFEIGSSFRAGNAKTFYESHSINDILPYIKVDTKSDDKVRTFHSAKGTEFQNTLVHFDSIEDFRKYILNSPHYIDSLEDDSRIYYVGCSRAMDNLFINIPEATEDDIRLIVNLNLNIHYEKL